jgi:hypothetical protein
LSRKPAPGIIGSPPSTETQVFFLVSGLGLANQIIKKILF